MSLSLFGFISILLLAFSTQILQAEYGGWGASTGLILKRTISTKARF